MYRPTPHFLAAMAAVLALVTLSAFAQAVPHTVNVRWTNATQATDGTALPASPDPNALRDTRIRYGTCNAARDAIAVATNLITVPATQTSLTLSLPDGVYCFQAQHSTEGAAADAVLPADGVSSWTLVVSKELKPLLKKPNRPQNVVIS